MPRPSAAGVSCPSGAPAAPAAIENLGDKARAKHIAVKVGAPLAPGTKDPVADAQAWREYLDVVVRERPGWGAFYEACQDGA